MTGIGSAVEWHNAAAAATTYCFYADPDVTAPSEETAGLQITVADGVETAEVDLATADAEKDPDRMRRVRERRRHDRHALPGQVGLEAHP